MLLFRTDAMSLTRIHQSQIQVLQEKFARAVKRQATRSSQDLSVKKEPGPASQLSGVVIDLTLDGDDD